MLGRANFEYKLRSGAAEHGATSEHCSQRAELRQRQRWSGTLHPTFGGPAIPVEARENGCVQKAGRDVGGVADGMKRVPNEAVVAFVG